MKEKNLTIRINEDIKNSFKKICDNESTTMSNRINDFIVNEVKSKQVKKIEVDGVLAETLKRFHGFSDEDIINEFKSITGSDNVEITPIDGYLVFYTEQEVNGEIKNGVKQKVIPTHLKDLFLEEFKNGLKFNSITGEEIEEFLKEHK